MLIAVAIAATVLCSSSAAVAPADEGPAGAFFFESFNDGWQDRWQYSSVKKYKGKFTSVQPEAFQDKAIQIPVGNVHYGISAVLPTPAIPADGLVVQYEVKFAEGHTCGGAYIKLLSETAEKFEPKRLKSKTPFTIMFGPDRCGPDARVHVIISALNPQTNKVSEHHLLSAPEPRADKLSHVYTLVLHNNNRFKVLIDGVEQVSGPLATADWGPPLQPPETVPDPQHVKPDDWLEEEMMDDPTAVKPSTWDDRRYIPDPHSVKPDSWLEHEPPEVPDPTASKPQYWDDDKDGPWLPPPVPNPACAAAAGCGPWKAPSVKNPGYKGPWIPPQVKNPKYKGPWKQRMVPNPDYFKLKDSPLQLLAPITAVAFELWTTEPGYTFDSVLLGVGEQGLRAAAAYMRQTWQHRHQVEYAAAMAASKAETMPPGVRYWASNLLLDMVNSRLLSSVKPRLQPVADVLQRAPEVAWCILLSPVLLLLLGVLMAGLRNGSRVTTAGDVVSVDEPGDEADRAWLEQLKQQRQEAKAAARASAANQNFAGVSDASGAEAEYVASAEQHLKAGSSTSSPLNPKQQQQQFQQEEGADGEEPRVNSRDLRRRRA